MKKNPLLAPIDEKIGGLEAGESPMEIIRAMLDVDDEIARAVAGYLSEAEALKVVRDGADALYDESGRYVFIPHSVWPHEQNEVWRRFEERVRYVRRFYDEEGRESLDKLLGDVDKAGWAGTPEAVRILEPDDGIRIYRARRADTGEAVRNVLIDPASELGPPPRNLRMGGRMNAPGIAIFYGAFTVDTCIAEIRPVVGGQVVVGAFEAVRPLRVLDLTVFRRLPCVGSMFRPHFRDELSRWRFLMGFHDIVSRPIQPHEEFLEYVPTQAVADYLANVLNFDGVIYSSAQAGLPAYARQMDRTDRRNVALFNAESIIESPPSAFKEASIRSEMPAGSFQPSKPCHGNPATASKIRYVAGTAASYRVTAVHYGTELS